MLSDTRAREDAAAVDATGAEPSALGTRSRGLPRIVSAWAPAVVVGVLAVALFPRLLDYARHSWDVLNFPWQLDFDEGINLNASQLLSQGVNIYRPNPPDHFVSSMYPPFFFILNALVIKLGGLSLLSGRLLAFLGALCVGAALWVWVYVETRRHVAGFVSALLWFSLGPVYVWSTFYKQDLPALALGITGCALVAFSTRFRRGAAEQGEGETNEHPRTPAAKLPPALHAPGIFWAIVPLALSFWVKQSSLAPMAAVGLFILLKDWRLGVRWTAAAVGAVLLPFAALDLLLKGGLHTHVLAFDHYGRSAARLGRNMGELWVQHWPLVLCGVFFLLLCIISPLLSATKFKPPLSLLYLFISAPAVLLSNSLPTANYNHLLDILAPLCLVLGVSLGITSRRVGETTSTPAVWLWAGSYVLILVLAGLQVATLYNKPGWQWYTPLGIPLAERTARMEKLSVEVRQARGEVLSEDDWLLLRNGKRVLYDDPAAMAALANAGAWDQSTLLQDINRRKFSLVILQYDLTTETYNPRWNNEALQALKANYEVRFRDVLFAQEHLCSNTRKQ